MKVVYIQAQNLDIVDQDLTIVIVLVVLVRLFFFLRIECLKQFNNISVSQITGQSLQLVRMF